MPESNCPYCSQAKKMGELFCSRHHSNMAALKSGVFYIKSGTLEECDWHVTRLSLNFNLDGLQTYHAGTKAFSISSEKYLLINEGQVFKTSVKSDMPNRMVTLAFRVGLAAEILRSMKVSDVALLDDPFQNSSGAPEFLEKTYSTDTVIQHSVSELIASDLAIEETEQKLENLLTHVIRQQLNIRKEILSIRKSKPATRLEIYKRLHWSLDLIHEHFDSDLTVEQLAKEACLSSFHFKRLFSELFNISPYQYLINKRLEKACSFLQDGLKVSDVCLRVGWKDPSSFTRLFKKRFSTTPEQFRSKVSQ